MDESLRESGILKKLINEGVVFVGSAFVEKLNHIIAKFGEIYSLNMVLALHTLKEILLHTLELRIIREALEKLNILIPLMNYPLNDQLTYSP